MIYADYKLEDCPELGYFRTDKPNPRGELCVKTKCMASGYFNDDEANKAGYTDGITEMKEKKRKKEPTEDEFYNNFFCRWLFQDWRRCGIDRPKTTQNY